jgi:hypothetical protein
VASEPTGDEAPAPADDEVAEPEVAADGSSVPETPARLLEAGEPDQQASAPSPRTSSGDLWEGLDASGENPASGLQGSAEDSGELVGAGSTEQQVLVAGGLLGGGLMLLMGGALVALVRRRPAVAVPRDDGR